MTRLVKLDGIHVNPEHVIDVEQTDTGQTRITTVGLVDSGEGFAVSAEIFVPQTEEEVARLLAGGEGDGVLAHLEGQLALYKDQLHDRNGEVQSLTAEVERLRDEEAKKADRQADLLDEIREQIAAPSWAEIPNSIRMLATERDGWIKRHDEQAANGISLLTRATDAERERDEARAALADRDKRAAWCADGIREIVVSNALGYEKEDAEAALLEYVEILRGDVEPDYAPAPEPEETDCTTCEGYGEVTTEADQHDRFPCPDCGEPERDDDHVIDPEAIDEPEAVPIEGGDRWTKEEVDQARARAKALGEWLGIDEPAVEALLHVCPNCGHDNSRETTVKSERKDGVLTVWHNCVECLQVFHRSVDLPTREPAGEAGDEGAGESGQAPGDTPDEGEVGSPDQVVPPEPAPATPTEPTNVNPNTPDMSTADPNAPLPDLPPTATDIPLHSRITATAHGECVLQPETGPRGERTVFVREGARISVTAPDGLDVIVDTEEPDDWSSGVDLHEFQGHYVATSDHTLHLWTSDPTVDVNRHKDAKYADPCVLHVRVVPDGQEMPDVIKGTPHDPEVASRLLNWPTDPAFFDPDAILAFVNTDPEAQRQVRVIGSYGNDTLHHRRHQEARQGTGLAGLCFNPEATDPKKRFTDGNHGWDALGDALLVLLAQGVHIHWDEDRENLAQILRSKLVENPMCQTPFGLVGKNWNEPSPFRHWYGRAAYRSFVDVLDLALAYKLLQDAGLVSAVLSPMDEAHVRENFRRFAAFVEADMKVSDPRMWRSSNVLAVECLRHLFPSLGLPDLSGYLTRWDGDTENLANSVLTPEDPPRWLDKGDYTAGNMMGVCYSVYAWVVEGASEGVTPDMPPIHIWWALRIWSGSRPLAWMWAKKTGTPQAGQDHRCARFQNSLTQLWFPMDLSDPRDPTRTTERVLGSQDHALYVVAGSRSGGAS